MSSFRSSQELEDYKVFLEAIEELREKSRDGWVVVVEGRKDVEALRALGVSGEIVVFNGFSSTADLLKNRDVVLLTDYDPKGMEIEKGLVEALMCYGKMPNTEIKRKIFSNVRKEITKVEEIYGFYKKLKLVSWVEG